MPTPVTIYHMDTDQMLWRMGEIQMRISNLLLAIFLLVAHGLHATAEQERLDIAESLRDRCLSVLRSGLHGGEFWPAIHAAEGLTLSGNGDEVIHSLKPKLANETDQQRRCGLARELVRAGHRVSARVMLDILNDADDYAHVHAAESLYKVFEIGDGQSLRRAFNQTENPPCS